MCSVSQRRTELYGPRRSKILGADGCHLTRVLLVDDNADSTEPLSLLLQTRGHETRVSTDGEEAIALADDFRPDCVVLDLGLPRMDGYEVARRLRSGPYGGDIVLVALTGWAGKDVRTKPRKPASTITW